MASVVVVEPWYGGSHREWLDHWAAPSRHDIAAITLPGRFWRWRLRSAAVEMAMRFEQRVVSHGRPDAVVASSLLDAAAFAGLARRSLGDTPVAVYLHENQLLYPAAPGQRMTDEHALTNWKSMLAADALWWNSAFHRDALLGALPGMLERQPEPVDHVDIDVLRDRSTVLWPGVAVRDLIDAAKPRNPSPVVLWNQRWDHDKNPRAVFTALVALADQGVMFDLVLAGENQGHGDDLAWVTDRLGDRVRHAGYLEPGEYRRWLVASDVVVSAADHEFFGIAIVEAIAAGAVPVLPDRLSFPELVGSYRGAIYQDGELRTHLAATLGDLAAARQRVSGLRESMGRFDVSETAAAHDDAIDALVGADRTPSRPRPSA